VKDDRDEAEGSPRGALIALVVVAALIAAVVLIVNRIGAASHLQDCVQSGRTNCAPLRDGGPS
jgi:hypothetical protein